MVLFLRIVFLVLTTLFASRTNLLSATSAYRHSSPNISCAFLLSRQQDYWRIHPAIAPMRKSLWHGFKIETPIEAYLRQRKEAHYDNPPIYKILEKAVKSVVFRDNPLVFYTESSLDPLPENLRFTIHCPAELRSHPAVWAQLIYELDNIENRLIIEKHEHLDPLELEYLHESALAAQWHFLHSLRDEYDSNVKAILNSKLAPAYRDELLRLMDRANTSLDEFLNTYTPSPIQGNLRLRLPG